MASGVGEDSSAGRREGTAERGRELLLGEGLQHQDGHSLVLASTVPNCQVYDPAFAYELATIVDRGLHHLVDEMVEPSRRVVADVHAEPLADVLAGPQVAEGVLTSKSVFERAARSGIEAPIMTGVYEMLHTGKSPRAVVQDLMTRSPKHERV